MPLAIGPLAASLLAKYGPVIAEKVLKLAFPDDPTIQQWIDLFSEVKSYEEGRAEAFAAAGKTPSPLPPS